MDLKKAVILAVAVLGSVAAEARTIPYEKVLKRWTRHNEVFTWDNFEARLIWNATYLSDEFREARRRRLNDLYEWTDAELSRRIREDDAEARASEVFIVSIYAGSSSLPEVGRDDARWRVVLEGEGGRVIESDKFERLPVTQVERDLYPYIDKWSHLYRVSFPRAGERLGDSFRLRLTGMPARSELSWKP